jgi:hypothetical protein
VLRRKNPVNGGADELVAMAEVQVAILPFFRNPRENHARGRVRLSAQKGGRRWLLRYASWRPSCYRHLPKALSLQSLAKIIFVECGAVAEVEAYLAKGRVGLNSRVLHPR